ncbi:hypothetical protein C2G38_2125728 [Gigaspora rosea]|uniref:Uncharacterized protein n=1 Tax=Gigaspora rosea TaxID=44941 RepID=A0A397U463_9GLOM|nr:hypothetical protein C2G38_2125728 [Gigaspora rosea]
MLVLLNWFYRLNLFILRIETKFSMICFNLCTRAHTYVYTYVLRMYYVCIYVHMYNSNIDIDK